MADLRADIGELDPAVGKLVDQINTALHPILNGKPTPDVLEALALAFWLSVRTTGQAAEMEFRIVNAYARLILSGPDYDG